MTAARILQLTLATALLGGCVYYNGMYNANRLAGAARKAERDGRTFEANNLWGQVATKAESVVARHPTSKYAEEAAVLRGIALARLGQCDEALVKSRIGGTERVWIHDHPDLIVDQPLQLRYRRAP